MRGNSWTRQPLHDAWDATYWDALCGTSWQLVAHELILTKKVTSDKRGTGRPLPRIVVDRIPEVEPRRLHVLSADIEAHGHTGSAALAPHERATKPHDNERRERIRTIIERTLTGKARMNAYIDRVAKTERVKKEEKSSG